MKLSQAVQILSAMFIFVLTAGAEFSHSLTAPRDPFVWDAVEKNSALPAMTNVAYIMFWVTNTSSAEATILSTETSCDCTVAEAASHLPWLIKPGESGWFRILINTRGKYGLVTKTATIHTSYGTQVLTVNIDIPISPAPFNVSARKLDQMASQKNRQAVFGEHCEVCHKWPAHGRTGESLFQSACGICHVSEHRAEMVPDLARLSIATSADYWRTNIIFGKPGSLMPAFANSEGGILDTNQIESLVEYLAKQYPSKSAASSPPPAVQAK